MSSANSLSDLTARLNPGGQQRLFEFFDAIDTDTAARFRSWLDTAPETEVTAAADLLNQASHGRQFAGWWQSRDNIPASQPARPGTRRRRSRRAIGHGHSPAYARSGNRDFTIGVAWLIGGVLVTAVSYSVAAKNPGGGRYLIASGAMIYGALRVFRGLRAR